MNTLSVDQLVPRARELTDETFRELSIPLYFKLDRIKAAERGNPLPYLQVATRLVRQFGLKTVVEIGSMRQEMKHALSEFDPACCIEGHSTLFWAETGADVFTVDVSSRCADVLVPWTRTYRNLHVHTADGIWFLNRFDRPIDLLYLDAWDVTPELKYAEKHLDAYRAAAPRMAKTSVVLIDDTDLMNGGKGKLAIPQIIRDGFELITWGRQAMLARE